MQNEEDEDSTITNVVKGNVTRRLAAPMSQRVFQEVSASERISARMTKASYINLTEGQHASQLYSRQYIKGYKLDTQLSTEHGSVFYNKKTNDLRLAYRGTQTNFDWTTNLRLATMQERNSSQIQALEKQMSEITKKYGRKPDVLTGHSKGGGQAIWMGEQYKIKTHTQDPFVPTRYLLRSKVQHKIVRTPTDVVSAGSNIAKFQSNISETLIKPTAGTSLLQAHDLNVVTGVDYNSTGNTTYHPRLKNHAFLVREIQNGATPNQVVEKLGYKAGSADEANVRQTYNALVETEAAHPTILQRAGFRDTGSTAGRAITSGAMRAGAAVTSGIGTTASKLLNARSLAGVGGGILAAEGLQRLGLDDDRAVAVTSGALGNLSSDAAGEVATRMAANRAGTLLAAETEGLAGIGVGIGKSLVKGGAGGILGYGVEYGTRKALDALHVDKNVTDYASAAAGGAAAGMIFGPEGAALGALAGVAVAGIEDLVGVMTGQTPEEPPPPPPEVVARDQLENELATAGQQAVVNGPGDQRITLGDPNMAAGMLGAGPAATAQHFHSLIQQPTPMPPPMPPPMPTRAPPTSTIPPTGRREPPPAFVPSFHPIPHNRIPIGQDDRPVGSSIHF